MPYQHGSLASPGHRLEERTLVRPAREVIGDLKLYLLVLRGFWVENVLNTHGYLQEGGCKFAPKLRDGLLIGALLVVHGVADYVTTRIAILAKVVVSREVVVMGTTKGATVVVLRSNYVRHL